MKTPGVIILVLLFGAHTVTAQFAFDDNSKSLTLLDNDVPVLTYNYERVPPPEGVPQYYGRACYIHPLYAPDGDVLTEDFPADHYHHRGVFWAWPHVEMGDTVLDTWLSKDVHQHHEKWLMREANDERATVSVQNIWTLDSGPDTPLIRETVTFTVHPLKREVRAMDFCIRLTNVSSQTMRIGPKDQKGYGGFCVRPDSARKPLTFTTAKGGGCAVG